MTEPKREFYIRAHQEMMARRQIWVAKIENDFDLIDLGKVNRQLGTEGCSIHTFLTMRLRDPSETQFDHEGWIGILDTQKYKQFVERVKSAGNSSRSRVAGWSIAQIITKTQQLPDGRYAYSYDRGVDEYSCDRDGDSYMIRLRFFHKNPKRISDLQFVRLRHLVGDNYAVPDRDVYGLFGSPGIRPTPQPR